MNLFIESLADYLIREWDRTLNVMDGPREARFIVQSLDPLGTLALFQALDEHRLAWLQKQSITCHFRVATALWRDWVNTANPETQSEHAVVELRDREWIDQEDRLTWYRNRTRHDEGTDGLAIVLVGLNHATDQGGLSDFHRIDESRIWREMDESFVRWIKRINERMGLSANDNEIEQFNTVLQQLFQVRPLRLGKLAEFLEPLISTGGCYQFTDFTERFFKQLFFWGIPPLFAGERATELRGKKGADALKEADAFISHQRYKTSSGQKKDWQKIVKALDKPDFELPETLDENLAYKSIKDYSDTLHAFIHEADADARARLLRTDLMPLLKMLKVKESKESNSEKIQALSGMSLEVLLEGIWRTLKAVADDGDGQSLADQLAGIHVELVRFDHDLTADEEESIGANESARELLQGCLGGLETVFEGMDCRLPADEDQSRLPRTQWSRKIPITLDLKLDMLPLGTSRARPNVQFKVTVADIDKNLTSSVFKWILGPTQPERVRFECAKEVWKRWEQSPNPLRSLPVFRIPAVIMTALYFAADADEANRLVIQAMTELEPVDLLADLPPHHVDPGLWTQVINLIAAYRTWLDATVKAGYYTARTNRLPQLLNAFVALAERVLDTGVLGAAELLRRLYKAFLVVDEHAEANDDHLPAAVAWGLSPPVLELTQAWVGFLADGFPEAVGELALGRNGKTVFERLRDLAQIHRPLAALVANSRQLSTAIKSYGLLHYLGSEPAAGKSLAVQTLLRDEESSDDDDVSDIVRTCEEEKVVLRVLEDYQQLYPFAEDGLRILAVNVRELQSILAGVDRFLDHYLKRSSPDWPAFHCTVMVYSTSSSPMAMENRLTLWRNATMERQREKGRPLSLAVGHRYAPRNQIINLLQQERRLYDIAFLFHFLRSGMAGRVEPAPPFEFDFGGWSGLQFPIAEYPRPIRQGDRYRRQSLISNRRLRIQARHADLSARLCYSSHAGCDHVIFGEVDYKPWASVVENLHAKAQWVACVDPFVDKRLLGSEDLNAPRKIVGFTSGLGAYGELNLTISTEQDSLKQLTDLVAGQLTRLLPFEQPDGFEAMAARVVSEAEEVIGLASLRAVVGAAERIREVVGFAAIRRALASPPGHMSQLLPMDSLLHWFSESDVARRPDLLQLTLEVRPNGIPCVHAVVVECKFAQQNPVHVAEARQQVQDGLRHLTGLLAPKCDDLRRLGFDRRFWWAQLHRAITSRSVVNLPEQEWQALDHALENLAEGQFEIGWQGAIFTFWTNVPDSQPVVSALALPAGMIEPPFEVPDGFAIQHLELGYEGVSALFAETHPQPLLTMSGPAISQRPARQGAEKQEEAAESIFKAAPEEPVAPTIAQPTSSGTASPENTATGSGQPDITGSKTKPAIAIDAFPLPEKILIGTRSNGESVYWHFGHPQLPNRHLLIFGASGSGKTYGIQCLLVEMAQQRLRSLIVDYTDGFLPLQVEHRFKAITAPKDHFVVVERLPLNPFRRQLQIIDPSIPPIIESPYQVATRIESIFASVFEMGDQQSAALIRVLQAGLEEEPDFALSGILPRLRADGPNGESLANKLEPLIQSQPFREGEESAWDSMLTSVNHWVHVLQLKGLAREIQKMVTEFVLWDLWDYAQNTGSKNRPIPIVLDEIQNLDHTSDSPIDKMLREGRKFGLSLLLATQTTSQFNQEQRDRLFQAGHKLFFKPANTEIDRFAQLLAQSTPAVSKADWGQRLAKLEKGQCWSLGPVLKSGGTFKEEAVLVSVTPLEERPCED